MSTHESDGTTREMRDHETRCLNAHIRLAKLVGSDARGFPELARDVEARINVMEKALRKYADEDSWDSSCGDISTIGGPEVARAALSRLPKGTP